jgi:hypothetical protein
VKHLNLIIGRSISIINFSLSSLSLFFCLNTFAVSLLDLMFCWQNQLYLQSESFNEFITAFSRIWSAFIHFDFAITVIPGIDFTYISRSNGNIFEINRYILICSSIALLESILKASQDTTENRI